MLIYTTGAPSATAEGDRINATIPSGKHAVEVSLSMFEAMTLATALHHAVEAWQNEVRFREVPEGLIVAFPQRARA